MSLSENQLVKNPLTLDFLRQFDEWVMDAQKKGKKIAFRCNCGCHRTGRLAGYAEMRFFGADPKTALFRMKSAFDSEQEGVTGKFFARKWKHGTLIQQIIALHDYIHHQPCSTHAEYCVKQNPDAAPAVSGLTELEPDDELNEFRSPRPK